jgi:pimeloyl-ACP methyl ester carboxylesterase
MKLEADRGGEGSRLLILLHGLGASREVWRPMLAANRWHGRWIAPDLRGHGASAHASSYALAEHATDVAALVDGADDITVLGHSMGGAVALALASGKYGIAPSKIFGLGIKVAWNDDELAGMKKMAASQPRIFETRDEAVARYLKVSGLHGLATTTDHGVTQSEAGWRLAYDPASASVGPPPMTQLMAEAKCPIHLARGTDDAMVTQAQLAVYDAGARDLPGGHNAMVEHPGAVWDWIGA